MASVEEQNLAQFKAIYTSTTPGIEGVKHDGDLYREAKWANKNSAQLLNDFTPGKAGVRHEGHLYGILRRTEYNTAQSNATIQALVGALKAVTAGESFDEAKLLASIDKTVRAAMADTVKVDISVEGNK